MAEAIYIAIGAAAGFVVAWLVLKGRLQASYEGRAKAAESIAEEREKNLSQKDIELKSLRDALDAERRASSDSKARLEETLKGFEEQRKMLDGMRTELSDTFKALSSAALESSSESFLRLAGEHLGKVLADTKGRLGEHKTAMDGLIKPLSETLKRYEEMVHQIEVKRKQEYTSLDEQIKMLAETHRTLKQETTELVTALRKPHIRGRWGEVTLKNVVELAGMSAHCDFTEQVSVDSEGGRLRPDMVVHMPGGHDIVIDSKVSMEALLDSASSKTEEERRKHIERHAKHVKDQIDRLSTKAYWNQFTKTPELAVLFISESALVLALEISKTLMEESLKSRVLIATPTTLFALLTAVAHGWRQEQVTKNAETISKLGKELYERIQTLVTHLNELGAKLSGLVEKYNESIGSMESRVLPSVRKFKELGVFAEKEIPEIKPVEKAPRNLSLLD